jgi:hypothetical protein
MKPIFVDVDLVQEGTQVALITSPDLATCDDLPAGMTPDGNVVSRWQFTVDERKAIAEGAPLYVFVMTGGRALQPMSLVVGNERLDDEASA